MRILHFARQVRLHFVVDDLDPPSITQTIENPIVTPNNIVAGSLVVQYWTDKVPVAAWISIFILTIICINMLGIKVFGEVEFWFSDFKVVVLTGLIILGLVIDLGGAPGHDRIGFR